MVFLFDFVLSQCFVLSVFLPLRRECDFLVRWREIVTTNSFPLFDRKISPNPSSTAFPGRLGSLSAMRGVPRVQGAFLSLELLLLQISRAIFQLFFSVICFFPSRQMVVFMPQILLSVLAVFVGCATALPSNANWYETKFPRCASAELFLSTANREVIAP